MRTRTGGVPSWALRASTSAWQGGCVAPGSPVSAGNTNPAFLDANGDDTALGRIDLANTLPESGSTVNNIQREANATSSFTGKALNGLYKKHYLSNSSDLKLIEEQLKYIKKHSKDGLYQAIETSFQLTINRLSRAKGERQKYITGEWFVFHKHEDENYYLCLWNHDSNDEKKSQEILKYTDIEFPELRILSNKVK